MRNSLSPQKIVFVLIAIPLLCLLTGCQPFYKVQSFENSSKKANFDSTSIAKSLLSPAYQNRYFILRSGSEAYHMRNAEISEDGRFITCQLDTLPVYHRLHLYNGRGHHRRYKNTGLESTVLNEVHLYTPIDTAAKALSTYTLPLDRVQKVEVIEKDKSKALVNAGIVVVGILTAVAIAIVVISNSINFCFNC